MLRSFRENIRGRAGKVLLAVIIVPFVFFGAESLLSGRGGVPAVLEINGEQIDEVQLSQEVVLLRNEMVARMGENVDFAQLSDERLVPVATERLLQRTLIAQLAESLDMSVPESLVQQTIVNSPGFQVDGKFSSEQMNRVLADRGFNLTLIKSRLSDDIRQAQFSTGVGVSVFAGEKDVDLLLNVMNESRSVRYVELNSEDYIEQVIVSDDDLNTYYENHPEQFTTPLSVDAEYILLSSDTLVEPVSEDAVKAEYELQKSQIGDAERRRVAHILFEVSDDMPEADAIARAEVIRGRLDAGEDFAALAKEFSQDGGSASQGGDLGFTEEDGAFPPAFEQAVFTLEQGGVSEPVVTDAGVHLITVTDIDSAEMLPYDEMKQTLEQQIQRNLAGKKYVEWSSQLADLAFNAENLTEPAAELDLAVQSVKGVTRLGLSGLTGDQAQVFGSAQVLKELFSDEVIEEGLNSGVVELDAEKSVVVRVDKVHQPRLQPLSEVESIVRQAVTDSKSRDYAKALFEDVAAQLEAGADLEAALSAKALTAAKADNMTRQSADFQPFFIEKIFSASRNSLEQGLYYAADESSTKSYLFQLTAIKGADDQSDETFANLFAQQAKNLYANQDAQAFFDSLKRTADIERF